MNDFIYSAALLIFIMLAVLIARSPKPVAPPKEFAAKVRYVVDGDTLYLHGIKKAIRIWGIDTPEQGEKGFNAATKALKRIVSNKRLTCHVKDVDRYGRIVAICYLSNGQDVGEILIKEGYAREYCRYSKGAYNHC